MPPFQSTCPLRGTTGLRHPLPSKYNYFNPRAPCGARRQIPFGLIAIIVFQSTCPLRGTTNAPTTVIVPAPKHFNPRAPCGARRRRRSDTPPMPYFNPRAPCGARRPEQIVEMLVDIISIHVPLAGHDLSSGSSRAGPQHFNPRAPCGARLALI